MAAAGCGVPVLGQEAAWSFTAEDGSALVSVDRRGVSARAALRELADGMSWALEFAGSGIEERLTRETLDLSLRDRDPETVAMLIGAAAGADVLLTDRGEPTAPAPTLYVSPQPSADTPAGQQRLRAKAAEWYQRFLLSSIEQLPALASQEMLVRMQLGDLYAQLGELALAAGQYEEVVERDPDHGYVPAALLRLAQCRHEMGELDEAEHWASVVSRMSPRQAETAAATVLLGRVLLDSGRLHECVATMTAAIVPLATAPEIVDIHLIAATAEWRRGNAERGLAHVRTLLRQVDPRSLSRRRWLDVHYLRGVCAEQLGAAGEATQALQRFLWTCAEDPRRGAATVSLGWAYLAQDRFVEARAAARTAMAMAVQMDPAWQARGRELDARVGLAIGQLDEALARLTEEVRAAPGQRGELAVFTLQAMIEGDRLQAAVELAGSLELAGIEGDRSRSLHVEALWRQARRTGHWLDFVRRSAAVVDGIVDEDERRTALRLLGSGYGELGDWTRAVEVFLGVL